jgi:hypothetical protein
VLAHLIGRPGKIKKTPIRGVTLKRKDYKLAYVTLVRIHALSCDVHVAQGGEQTFEFPELFKKKAEDNAAASS